MASLNDPNALGQIYEAVGPERLTQNELITYMYALTSRVEEERQFRIKELLLDPETFAKAFIAQNLGKFGNHYVFHSSGLDRLERDSISDTSEGYPDLSELGVKPASVTEKMPWELAPFDQYAYYFYETPEEKRPVRLPHILAMDEERAINARRAKGLVSLIPGANLVL